jgi:serine/threonine protein kinase
MKDELIGQVLADKYRIEAVMRENGIGKLYRGNHLLMDKPVAIKILPASLAIDETIVNRFSIEARTLSRLSHPNIPSVNDYGNDKSGAVFIVMDYTDGETLKDAIRQDGKLSLERATKITNQIASALSSAHAQGVIHRNLNSENILLTRTPDVIDFVKVLDFGTVKMDENGVLDDEVLTQKAEYLSPEQCSQSADANEQSDVYSLGIILYEMLTGEVPFASEKPTDVMLKHVQEPPPPILSYRPDLPIETETIIQRALAKQPMQRYQSAIDLADTLKRLEKPLPIEEETIVIPKIDDEIKAQAAAVAAKPIPQNQNNLWKTAFIILAGIVSLGSVMIYFTQSKQTNPSTEMMTDANGQPLQPANPATGATEQDLANMSGYTPNYGNTNGMNGIPGGDGYDPWASGGRPPVGAPNYGSGSGGYPVPNSPGYVPPPQGGYEVQGNSNFYVDPNSPFTRDNVNVPVTVNKLVNVKVGNTNVNAKVSSNTNTNTKPNVKPTKTPTTTATPTTDTVQPDATPVPKATKTPVVKPTPKPKTDTPTDPKPSSKTTVQTGKEQDSLN